jgi:hypothetical protein
MFGRKRAILLTAVFALSALLTGSAGRATAGPSFLEYGDENLLGTGTYPSDPKAGATLVGLAPGAVTDSNSSFQHGFPFSPGPGAFPGTDQIFVGSVQTGAHDGYSVASQRINGPMVLKLDYSSLVPAGHSVQTLTLGLATDDFQFPAFGQPFVATINGFLAPQLTDKLNSLNEGGPQEHFFTIGLSPAQLSSSNVLTVSIDEGGDGGDGFAMDFATVGVTTAAFGVPEPSTLALACLGVAAVAARRLRRG